VHGDNFSAQTWKDLGTLARCRKSTDGASGSPASR